MGNPWCLQEGSATLMLSSWYRGDRFVGDSGEHIMEVDVENSHHDWCEHDVSKHLEYRVWWCVRRSYFWSPGATRMTMLIMLPWKEFRFNNRHDTKEIAWCWAVGEWAVRRWNHRGGPFQSVPKKTAFFRNLLDQFCKGEIQKELNFFQLHNYRHKWS